MDQLIVEMFKQSPLVAILLWIVYNFQNTLREKDRQHQQMVEKLIEVTENNTRVMTKVESTISENTKATETLSERVLDVLTRRNHGK